MRHKSARDNATFTGKDISGSGSVGGGPRDLVDAFYAEIDARLPGDTPVPIPPSVFFMSPKHDLLSQAFIFADYAVRKFAPIALKVAGLKTEASKLRNLPEIVDEATANAAANAAAAAAVAATKAAAVAAKAAARAAARATTKAAAVAAKAAVAATKAAAEAAKAAAYAAAYAASDAAAYAYDAAAYAYDAYAAAAAAAAAITVVRAAYAELNPEATWEAVNEMLAELSGARSNKSTLKRKASPKKVRNNPVEFSILRKDTKQPESFQNIDANIRRHFPDDWVDPDDLYEMERDLGAEWYYGWYEWIQVGHTFKDIVAKIKKAAGMERNNYSEGPKKGSREEYYERLVAIYNWLDRKYILRTKHVSLR
jgi:hypothetical protein